MPPQTRPKPDDLFAPGYFSVSGFKALRDACRIELRPLTILAGGNSSGKSSAMQPLLLLKQTLEASYDPGALLLDGPHASFNRLEQILSRGRARDDLAGAFRIGFGALPHPAGYRRPATPGSPLSLSFSPRFKTRLDKGFGPVGASVEVAGRWIEIHELMEVGDALAVAESIADVSYTQRPDLAGTKAEVMVDIKRFRVEFGVAWPKRSDGGAGGLIAHGSATAAHMPWLSSILHLPGLRGHRERTYDAARVGPQGGVMQAHGPFTAYVASILSRWQESKSKKLEQVGAYLQQLGLTWKVRANRLNAAQVELKVARTNQSQLSGANDLVDLADVGFGVSQVLPVVVALIAAVKNQVVYIEQPELHLHPRAQVALGRILAEAAARGVRVVVETHSPLILRAAQIAVAREHLTPSQVGLHWFSRDEETGWASVKLAELDSAGAFGDWPVDFSEVEAAVDAEWLNSAFG